MPVLLNVSLLATLATGVGPFPADTVREYRGTYETGFEVSWFHPCDAPSGDDVWWVTLTDRALHQRDSIGAKLPAPQPGQQGSVFVRWRGTTSARMPMGAGHMGRGSRYMLVHEILDIRPSGGCQST
ncbi:MAG TPA: hypothetical protein VGP25_08220 [Gemmatimonadaceae bacterium]|jgi:hypothetical protein|nr:hypothetical protein [Gemmatimonadaceae bacterium]